MMFNSFNKKGLADNVSSMRIFNRFLADRISIIIILLLLSGQVDAQTIKSFVSDNRTINVKDFDQKINKMIDELGVPGVSLAVIEEGKIAYSNFYGKKNLKENENTDENTVFEAASLTKMYLVYVVQKLIQNKTLDLDKPLYQYMEWEPLSHDPRYKLITTRMILSHTSGIENWRWNNNKDVLEILSNPGEKFVYSGEGFQYLAKVVEKLLNEPYDQYVKRMVLDPFALKNTYLKFDKSKTDPAKESPSDYATGYTQMRDELEKWKNYEAVPASGAQTTGKDFAEFMISMFDRGNLSQERIKDMLKPIMFLDETKTGYMGEGFFTIPDKKDTIVSFSGNNDGFRSEVFYSVVNKRGFVFFTNSDQGKLITRELNKMTTQFGIEFLFQDVFFKYYPNSSISLQKKYRDGGVTALKTGIAEYKKKGKLDDNTLNELSEILKEKEPGLTLQLLKENISIFPKSVNTYGLLGRIYMDKKEYKAALENFTKAKELGFSLWDLDEEIKTCQKNL